MGDATVGDDNHPASGASVAPLSAEAEARICRRVAILLGLVPLGEMTQAETDWAFRQCVSFND